MKIEMGNTAVLIMIVTFTLIVLWDVFLRKLDSSDKSRWERSNMSIRTDHLTGLQYLEGKRGGLTPRLNYHREHMKGYTEERMITCKKK